MRALLFLAAFSLFPVLSMAATKEGLTQYQLKNGLDILVIEDHRAPVVVHMLWYKAGAADEPAGHSGIAHFLEHLLFKATDSLERGEFSKTVAALGGRDNAFTAWDYTGYYQRVAAKHLERMMQMEASRVRGLRLTEGDIATERDVILEERAQRTETNPAALMREQMMAAQYSNHRYGVPISGWRHEAETLSLEDALAFYKRNYAPNNAILVVAGDVEPEAVKTLAETYYGPLAPTVDLPKRVRPKEPPQRAERRLVYKDERVAQPYVMRSYLAPERNAGDQKGAAALTLFAALLGGDGINSYLGEKLQLKDDKAVYVASYYSGLSLDETTFGLIIAPRPEVSLAEAEEALDAAVDAFFVEGVDLEKLARLKRQIKASDIYALDNIEARANHFGRALVHGLTLDDALNWNDILQTVTADDILAAGKRVLNRDRAVTGWLMKDGTDAERSE
ncbi:MAG: M16 family metallopeptidase [Halocynthiibacter sp.]